MVDGSRLSRDSWTDAALDAVADGGLAAIAVEPLATRLGTTKGSFYWHFANRDALVAATVQRWAHTHTESLIDELTPIDDPTERLRRLFDAVVGRGVVNRAELALLAHADDPAVAPTLRRVTERRVEFIAAAYRQLGHDDAAARHRALLVYTAHIGLIQAQRATSGTLLPADDRRGYLRFLRATFGLPADGEGPTGAAGGP